MKPARQTSYDDLALERLKQHFLSNVTVEELDTPQARRACYEARLPVFWPTPEARLPVKREAVLNLSLVDAS